MSLAVMAQSSYTHSVLKVSTASSLMVLLSVTDFSDRRAAKPNSPCLQCTCFFLSQGSITVSFGYESACSRTSFLMKRPIKVSKRSFNDLPQERSHWGICLELEQKWLKLVSPRRWRTTAWSPSVGPHMLLWLWHMRLSAGPSWVVHGKTKHTSWCWATFGEPILPQQHPLPICEDKISGGTLWTLWV